MIDFYKYSKYYRLLDSNNTTLYTGHAYNVCTKANEIGQGTVVGSNNRVMEEWFINGKWIPFFTCSRSYLSYKSSHWFISDTHFYDSNIFDYRSMFKSIDEMNNYILCKLNKVIGTNDYVWVLGDFSSGTKEQNKYILNTLNGNKILICGNHDKRTVSWWKSVGFNEVVTIKHQPLSISFDNVSNIWLSHMPIYLKPDGYLNLHGHFHTDNFYFKKDYINVSVDLNFFKPVKMDFCKRVRAAVNCKPRYRKYNNSSNNGKRSKRAMKIRVDKSKRRGGYYG